jgi:hypothetical protein
MEKLLAQCRSLSEIFGPRTTNSSQRCSSHLDIPNMEALRQSLFWPDTDIALDTAQEE